MAKKILFTNEARNKMKKGITTAANAVRITLGPRGRNVAIQNPNGFAPEITNDGRTILDNIFVKDHHEQMGIELAKQTARKTDDEVEDGTTTTTILYDAIIEEGMKKLETNSPMIMRNGIELAANLIVEELKLMKVPVVDLVAAAKVSSESQEMAEIVAEVVKAVGSDGIVTCEESDDVGLTFEVVDGMQIKKGFVSPFMINRSDRFVAEYKDIAVLITDRRILSSEQFLTPTGGGLIPKLVAAGVKDLFIIAEDVDSEALQTFLMNKARRAFNVLAVRAPGYGDTKREILEDIAAKTGATIVTEQSGTSFADMDFSMLGKARTVVSTQHTTTIGGGDVENTEKRVNELVTRKNFAESASDKDFLTERIAQLTGRVAIISYGAKSDTQMKYLKKKLQDTVGSTKAAVAEGVVQGGGAALILAAHRVKEKLKGYTYEAPEMKAGVDVVLKAIQSPLFAIMENAGVVDEFFGMVHKIQTSERAGYNALTNKVEEDMIEAGVVDAVKVTRNALINAATDAALFLTTEVSMAEEVEEKK